MYGIKSKDEIPKTTIGKEIKTKTVLSQNQKDAPTFIANIMFTGKMKNMLIINVQIKRVASLLIKMVCCFTGNLK